MLDSRSTGQTGCLRVEGDLLLYKTISRFWTRSCQEGAELQGGRVRGLMGPENKVSTPVGSSPTKAGFPVHRSWG